MIKPLTRQSFYLWTIKYVYTELLSCFY